MADAAITPSSIKQKIEQALQAEHVEVEDVSSGCGESFSVVVVSKIFEGKPLLQRHRLVNGCLQEELKRIHAFSQKCYTVQQWEAMQGRN